MKIWRATLLLATEDNTTQAEVAACLNEEAANNSMGDYFQNTLVGFSFNDLDLERHVAFPDAKAAAGTSDADIDRSVDHWRDRADTELLATAAGTSNTKRFALLQAAATLAPIFHQMQMIEADKGGYTHYGLAKPRRQAAAEAARLLDEIDQKPQREESE